MGMLEPIYKKGFETRLSNMEGLYGAGTYFAEESCKSFQYCDQQDERCIVLARVTLGHAYRTQGPLQGHRLAPQNCDSVVAEVGIGNGINVQQHREFVIFNG